MAMAGPRANGANGANVRRQWKATRAVTRNRKRSRDACRVPSTLHANHCRQRWFPCAMQGNRRHRWAALLRRFPLHCLRECNIRHVRSGILSPIATVLLSRRATCCARCTCPRAAANMRRRKCKTRTEVRVLQGPARSTEDGAAAQTSSHPPNDYSLPATQPCTPASACGSCDGSVPPAWAMSGRPPPLPPTC